MDLKGRTALITGAGKRIGREIALALAGEGVNVVVHYSRSSAEAAELKEAIEARGVKSWLARADFDKKEYEGLVEKAAQATGGIDILVNNASIFPASRLDGATFEGLLSNIQVNAWAPSS